MSFGATRRSFSARYVPSFLLAAALSATLGIPSAHATKPERAVADTYEDFAEGNSKSTSLTDTGTIEPAPAMTQLTEIGAGQIWCLLAEDSGNLLAGTSPNGEVYRVDAAGKSVLVKKFDQTHVYAMAKNARGEVFVGTSPDGKVYRLPSDPKATPEVYFDPHEKYIWSMAFDKSGALYVGTGTQGRIYQVTSAGTGKLYYDSDETHIRSLAVTPKGDLLAGTSDNGQLLEVTAENKAVVLAASGKQDVNRIAIAPDGVVYFSATGSAKGGSSKGGPPPPPTMTVPPQLRSLLPVPGGDENKPPSAGASAGNGGAGRSGGGGSSVVFKLDSSMYPAEFWTTKESVLTLDYVDGKVYAGTSGEGYFYSLNERGEATRLLKVDGELISAAMPWTGGTWVLASSNPSKLFRVGGPRNTPGVYESDVVDSGLFARWGAVNLKSKGRVEVRTRSGNTPKPDKTWYDWALTINNQSQSPAARYLQIELRLTDATVDRFEIVYLNKNLPPKIDQIEVLPSGAGYIAIVPPPIPSQPKSAEQLLTGGAQENGYKPIVRFQPSEERGLRTIVWKASDPNGDELRYTVSYRADNSTQWRTLTSNKDGEKEPVLSWDSAGWPDGNYYLKVEASDAEDNAPGEELKDTMISKIVLVDNAPPKIKIDSTANGLVDFTVSDDASGLLSVMVSRNGKDYKPLRPRDGILDAKTETFQTNLAVGEVLFIRAEDEAGNISGAMAEGGK